MSSRHSVAAVAVALTLLHASAGLASAGPVFDELRFGTFASIEPNDNREPGVFITGMALFDPWDRNGATGWTRAMTPRLHVGGDISTAGEANQVYAGFSWTADLTDMFFLEGGLGGSINDGKLQEDGTPGPKLGSAVLFHEYAALGVSLTPNWRVIAEVEHSSNANLADGPNSGLSRAGVLIGYKF